MRVRFGPDAELDLLAMQEVLRPSATVRFALVQNPSDPFTSRFEKGMAPVAALQLRQERDWKLVSREDPEIE